MKLVRFGLLDAPGQVRSGIYYDNRIYETNGSQAVGIHDLSKLTLLAPVGSPPSVRRFGRMPGGELTYEFLNPTILQGPLAEVCIPMGAKGLRAEVSLGVIVSDPGEQVELEEAPGFVLGFTVAVVLVSAESRLRERQAGYGPGPSSDIAILVGPFLTTPDELEAEGGWVDRAWQATLRRNQRDSVAMSLEAPVAEMLVTASRASALAAGDLLLTGPVSWEAEDDLLLPADQASCGIPGLGELHFSMV